MDSNRRDPSDALYNNIGFPIPNESMGIFIGMSAISHFLNGENWGIEDSVADSLSVLDEQYEKISKILEIPIFFDSPQVRQVIDSIRASRNSILYIANNVAKMDRMRHYYGEEEAFG